MKKVFCDRCGGDITWELIVTWTRNDGRKRVFELCKTCDLAVFAGISNGPEPDESSKRPT